MKTLSDMIFEADSPWDNPYQGTDKKVVFVCSAGILRSATGARLYAKKYNTRCCGSEDYALIPCSDELIVWADEIVFVNKENFRKWKEFDFEHKSVKVLDIPDQFPHMDPRLITAFEEQYEPV